MEERCKECPSTVDISFLLKPHFIFSMEKNPTTLYFKILFQGEIVYVQAIAWSKILQLNNRSLKTQIYNRNAI